MSVVANVAINVDSRGAVGKLRDVQSQAQQTERAFSGLSAAVGKLAIAAAAIQGARFIFAKTAEIESQTRSLQVLTGSAQKAKQIIEELQQLGAVTPFTSTELIDSAKRLQAFGVEADKVVETTRRLADVSGATGAELQGLVTAYGQVQAKGRLQGEELLQFQERGVALQTELRKMYGLSGDEFQKALQKGQISAQAVEVAIQRLTSAGGKYANGAIAQSNTLSGRLSTLQDGIDGLARGIGAALSPAIKAVLNEAIFAINTINNLIATGARAKGFGLGDTQRKAILDQAQKEAEQLVNLRRIKDPFERNRQFQEVAAQRERDLIEAYGIKTGQVKPTIKAPAAPTTLPPLMAPTTGGGGGGRAKDAADEAKKLAEELKQSMERGDSLFRQFSRQAALLGDMSETERKRLQIQYDYQDRAREIAELKNAEQRANLSAVNDEIKRLETLQLQTEELKKQIEAFYELAGFAKTPGMLPTGAGAFRTDINLDPNDRAQNKIVEFKRELEALKDPINMAQRGAQGIGDAFSSSFRGLVTGTQSAQEALSSFFQNVANAFIDMATQMIAQMVAMYAFKTLLGLFGGSGGGLFTGAGPVSGASVFGAGQAGFNPAAFGGMKLFADGGLVTRPTMGMVGEGGQPEYIIPASKMQAAMMRYSAGARGEAVIPGGNSTGDGGTMAVAVGAGQPIDVRYTVERINSVDYVTADQFQRGMAQAAQQGAERGQRMTLQRIQQSPSTRRRIGM